MDGRGGCCIARYPTVAGGTTKDHAMKMDHIMLRFRPIAPKPTTDPGNSSPPVSTATYAKKTGRGKRRYVRSSSSSSSNSGYSSLKGKRCIRKRKSHSPERNDKPRDVVTLPLLPEIPERKYSPARESRPPSWSFKNDSKAAAVAVPERVRVLGTWVRVESVTSMWVDPYRLGRTDGERLMNLDRDTCPGFVSEGLDVVKWTNRAYKEMVGRGCGSGGEVAVWLAVTEGVELPMAMSWSAFTCSVRLVTWGKEKNSQTLPCDVWRLDCGRFAWRLDLDAALSLGR